MSKKNVHNQDIEFHQNYVDKYYKNQNKHHVSRIESIRNIEEQHTAAGKLDQDWLNEKCRKGLEDLYAMEEPVNVKTNVHRIVPVHRMKLSVDIVENPLEEQCILEYLTANKNALGLEKNADDLRNFGYEDLLKLFNRVTDRREYENHNVKNPRRRRHTSFGETLAMNKIDDDTNRKSNVLRADESGYESDSTRNDGDSPRGSIKSQCSADNVEFSRRKNFRMGLRRGDVKELQVGSDAETRSLVCDECKKPEQNMSLYQRFLMKKSGCIGPNSDKRAEIKIVRFNKRLGEDAGISLEYRDPSSRSNVLFITALSGPAAR